MSSSVNKASHTQEMKCEMEARAYLAKAAEETVFYVALGRVYRLDLAAKFGLTEQNVGGILSKAAVKLVDEIRAL